MVVVAEGANVPDKLVEDALDFLSGFSVVCEKIAEEIRKGGYTALLDVPDTFIYDTHPALHCGLLKDEDLHADRPSSRFDNIQTDIKNLDSAIYWVADVINQNSKEIDCLCCVYGSYTQFENYNYTSVYDKLRKGEFEGGSGHKMPFIENIDLIKAYRFIDDLDDIKQMLALFSNCKTHFDIGPKLFSMFILDRQGTLVFIRNQEGGRAADPTSLSWKKHKPNREV